jgi:phage tail-like protein
MSNGIPPAFLNMELDWQVGIAPDPIAPTRPGDPGAVLPRRTLVNLEVGADGSLTLARVPRLIEVLGTAGAVTDDRVAAPAASGIAIAAGRGGDLYVSDPAGNRIWRFDGCEDEPAALLYLHGPGSEPGRVTAPRGLAISPTPGGDRLYVADSGNHRNQVIDLATRQSLAVWGQPDPYAPPARAAEPGRLNDPWDVAVDRAGNVYVVDHGNRRVQKFTPSGRVDDTFRAAVAAQPIVPVEPIRVAIAGAAGDERVYVLDRHAGAPRVVVVDTAGASRAPAAWNTGLADAIALAATDDAVYVGGAGGTIVKFSRAGVEMSRLPGGADRLAALAVDGAGGLLAGPGGLPVRRLRLDGGFTPAGFFRFGPFATLAEALAWHRWRVFADPPAENARVQLFTYTSREPADPPVAPGDNPFATGGWVAEARDELDVLVLNGAVRDALGPPRPGDPVTDVEGGQHRAAYFWLGGLLRGDEAASPVLRQMRIDYTPATALRYLPAVYREGARRRLFLDLALAELGSELGRVEEGLAALPRLFDPAAAPAEWLPWLAGWLDFDLIEDWAVEDKRNAIAGAFALYAQRGTAEGLRRYLELYAGVAARIEEPGASAALFTLDENVALGFNTALAPAHEQGAVLASTATVGGSHLLDAEDIGAPAFEDVANRFCVQVYAAQLAEPRTRDRITAVLEREKPAHTLYHLCVIEPRMRVGFQARIGVDSIVAGPPPELRLGDELALGSDTVLPDQPHRTRRVGHGFRVGGTL